jgi:hypothetical protein
MRFVVKWNNGYWKLFDRAQYRDVDCFDSLIEAEAAAHAANWDNLRKR